MREKATTNRPTEQPQSMFTQKEGRTHQLGRSQRNLEKYAERQAAKKKNADRGTLTFSSGK